MLYVLLVFIFLTVLMVFSLGFHLLYGSRIQIRNRLQEQTQFMEAETVQDESQPAAFSFAQRINQIFVSSKLYHRLQQVIARSYIKIRPEELVRFSILGAMVLILLGVILRAGALLILLGFLAGLLIPVYCLRLIGMQRAKQLNKQLPQALSILSNGLRAGFSFPQALGIVGKEMEAPISDEFHRILRETQLGKPMDEALSNFEERANDEDASFLVATLQIQMQVGGDLSEILDIIAKTIRERAQLKGQIKTLISQSKFSALIIGVLPIAIAVILFMMNPEYMMVLFTDPLGLIMVFAAIGMMLFGVFALYKIVNIKV